jgi:putative transcriptional regulator
MGAKGDGMSKFGEDLVQGLTEAVAFARGRKAGARVHVVETPDVRAIRRGLHMSQHEFADAFRIPVATVKNWEQGRRMPDAPAAAYLQAIARRPEVIREALQAGSRGGMRQG